ncbi:restriction endonuclease [Streptomyces sp. ID05-04B]|uniref:restriction endonuclease n=1 Tax=unclassified Streptomyces TaxID=2593676 RepID=UPI000D1AF0F6|nr:MULTISPECIES: restriction endonuclease [unclassified Streptomyces]AVV44547.1 restriction endonuclease [Streptomyces sp. P3]MDX5567656.1 restriction endonuclease [Streptomyces sp. ID05-04B]
MAVPVRAPRPVRHPRRFELRATALYFVLLAVLLTLAGTVARTAAAAAERRPAWALALALVTAGAVVAGCRRGRRVSAARLARRAAAALDEATMTAVDVLDAPSPAPSAGTAPAPGCAAEPSAGRDGTQRTLLLVDPVDPVDPADLVDQVAVDTEEIAYEALDPDEFEQAIADLCRRDGCRDVDVVGGAGDLGADVVARTPDGRLVVIQCKRYRDTNRVGSQDLQRFGGTCYTVHGADVAVVVTTGDFTAPALEYADQCGIVCMDGRELQHWQDGVGPRPWEHEFPAGQETPSEW